jgi:hypothetical protein
MNNNSRFKIVNDGGLGRVNGKFYGSLGAARSALSNILHNYSYAFEKARFNPDMVNIAEYELVPKTCHGYNAKNS